MIADRLTGLYLRLITHSLSFNSGMYSAITHWQTLLPPQRNNGRLCDRVTLSLCLLLSACLSLSLSLSISFWAGRLKRSLADFDKFSAWTDVHVYVPGI